RYAAAMLRRPCKLNERGGLLIGEGITPYIVVAVIQSDERDALHLLQPVLRRPGGFRQKLRRPGAIGATPVKRLPSIVEGDEEDAFAVLRPHWILSHIRQAAHRFEAREIGDPYGRITVVRIEGDLPTVWGNAWREGCNRNRSQVLPIACPIDQRE